MKSIVSYKNRGEEGSNKYRGNCTPRLIEDLHQFFKFDVISDYMRGSNTTGDVASKLGIQANTYDLSIGFDLMNSDIPERNEFCFWHPPYWDIIHYSGSQWGQGEHPSDLSKTQSYEQFMKQINYCMMKQYHSLENGGRMAVLVGDVKRKGKLYSMFCDMVKPGMLENIIIKEQHNCWSNSVQYSGRFIPIVHEYLMIVKKDSPYMINLKMTKDYLVDVRDSLNVTWKDVVAAALEQLGTKASLEQIYKELEGHKKANSNSHWKEKIRQTLQIYKGIFKSEARGVWSLL